ncbi:hypothetical protein [Streptomyces sp. SID4982]|uniref:hypothetical protein n=1 Tax=Streptomyces sp. SID4982 TaxID=2690291 RepID=UPI001368F1F4|nr:hypothetical protein [Streptomyces sp. SID4982]
MPPPLPKRGAQGQRPNPAEAVPGISVGDRVVVEARAGMLPTPRGGVVPGGGDKPRLPRRRAQEHIVPQLRGGPAPRQESDLVVGHDPGLMAAFQRGVGLAESQQSLEAAEQGYVEPPPAGDGAALGAAYMEVSHTDPGHMVAADVAAGYMEPEHVEVGHMEVGHAQVGHVQVGHVEPGHMDVSHTDPRHLDASHMDAAHTEPGHMEPAPMDRSSPPA